MVCCTTFLTATWIYYFLGHILPYPTFNDYITHFHHIKDLLLILSQLYRYMFQRKMSPCFLFLLPFPHLMLLDWDLLFLSIACNMYFCTMFPMRIRNWVVLQIIRHTTRNMFLSNIWSFGNSMIIVGIVLWISNFAEYLKVNKGIVSEPLKSNAYLACNVI